ncbi:hypothetical protein AOL_s00091g34 [Orbilia oligospora ATCC 24927]|uniref:Uncharacterized protein n=1 Tax=Arthrobotrys oligospora (strain ATCC 24927 / CBS 115.81 / DSM 1491) TaxID=756982 RepID=G1XHY2_ARTOA|nr:hypothetical protein AOL_s00091g34 [Orbilia oligospora ATCC 24927]EGX47213.1 hypothetical protein AOL_s00091g34 [Orbilia oligospora ATCC 24927]
MFTLLYRAVFSPPPINSTRCTDDNKGVYWLQLYDTYEQWYQGVDKAFLAVNSGVPVPSNYSLDYSEIPSNRSIIFAKILQSNDPPLQISDRKSYDAFIATLKVELARIEDLTIYLYAGRFTEVDELS